MAENRVPREDYELHAGDALVIEGTAKDRRKPPQLVDLTGVQAIDFGLFAPDGSGPVLISKSLGSGVAVLDAAAGLFQVTVGKDDSAGLDAGTYYYEIRITDSAGLPATVLKGAIRVIVKGL